VVAEAANQRTRAAFEALGGVRRVHFYPFQARPAVRRSAGPLDGAVTSSNGFPSDKDSGSCST
jgi:hypothetical protein